jgi:hypothetical protein
MRAKTIKLGDVKFNRVANGELPMKSSHRAFELRQGSVLGSLKITKLQQHPTLLLIESRYTTLEKWLG